MARAGPGMEEANPVKKVMNMEIEGTRPRWRLRKRWRDNVKKNMDHFQVRAKDTEDRHMWTPHCGGGRQRQPTLQTSGKPDIRERGGEWLKYLE